MEATYSSKTSDPIIPTQLHIPEDGIVHNTLISSKKLT
jgi:hypothetical protein